MNATPFATTAYASTASLSHEEPALPKTPRFAMTSCSQCGRDTGPGDAGHSSCATHTLDHINALASVNCVDDISRREKLASIQMLASEAIRYYSVR